MNDTHTSLGVVRALWQDLLRGALRVVPAPHADGYELLLAPGEPAGGSPTRQRRQACCEAVLRGEPQKVVAADLGLAPATLSGLLKSALCDMGIEQRCSRVPTALPLLLHAAESGQVLSLCQVDDEQPGERHWLVNLSLPPELLAAVLSPGEQAVVEGYLAGQSYLEIAVARRTAPRTVANQLALSFKKLGVSGRFSLIRTLVERGGRAGTPITLTLRRAPVQRSRHVPSPSRSVSAPEFRRETAAIALAPPW